MSLYTWHPDMDLKLKIFMSSMHAIFYNIVPKKSATAHKSKIAMERKFLMRRRTKIGNGLNGKLNSNETPRPETELLEKQLKHFHEKT